MLGCKGVHGSNKGELVGALAKPGQLITQMKTGDIGFCRFIFPANFLRGIRLHVIHVNVTGTTLQEHEYHINLLTIPAGCLIGEDFRQRQAQWRDSSNRHTTHSEEFPSIHR
jgi:hypothetical protein